MPAAVAGRGDLLPGEKDRPCPRALAQGTVLSSVTLLQKPREGAVSNGPFWLEGSKKAQSFLQEVKLSMVILDWNALR